MHVEITATVAQWFYDNYREKALFDNLREAWQQAVTDKLIHSKDEYEVATTFLPASLSAGRLLSLKIDCYGVWPFMAGTGFMEHLGRVTSDAVRRYHTGSNSLKMRVIVESHREATVAPNIPLELAEPVTQGNPEKG